MKKENAMPVIRIHDKGATGTLNRRAKSFAFGDTGGLALLDIDVNWPLTQSSGPVSFSFFLDQNIGVFPAGTYDFAGWLASDKTPCPTNSIACGTVNWPTPKPDGGIEEVDWQASGGPIPEDEYLEDAEEPSADKSMNYSE